MQQWHGNSLPCTSRNTFRLKWFRHRIQGSLSENRKTTLSVQGQAVALPCPAFPCRSSSLPSPRLSTLQRLTPTPAASRSQMSCQIRQNLCIWNLEKQQGPEHQAETARARERRRASQSLRERLCAGCRNGTRRSPNSSAGSSRLSLPAARDPPCHASQLLRHARQQQQPRHSKAERPLAENCAAEDSRLPCDKISFSSSGLCIPTPPEGQTCPSPHPRRVP